MAHDSIDAELIAIFPFAWGTATTLDIVEDTAIPLVNAGETLFSFGNMTFTIGAVVAILTLGFVLFHRDASITETGGVDAWAVYVTVGLVLAPPLFPAFADTIAKMPAALIAFTVQNYGFMVVSYLN